MKTYYRDFLSPTRPGVPDRSRSRAAEFGDKRSNLGHNALSHILREEGVLTGYRIYFSAGRIDIAHATAMPVEESKR